VTLWQKYDLWSRNVAKRSNSILSIGTVTHHHHVSRGLSARTKIIWSIARTQDALSSLFLFARFTIGVVAIAICCRRRCSRGSNGDATLQKGNTTVGARGVGGIGTGKELTEGVFFVGNASAKKAPTRECKSDRVQWIAQQELRSDTPVKESHIRGMPKDGIDAVSNQYVIFFLGVLDQVVEGFAGCGHGETAYRLGSDHQKESQVGDVRQQ